MDYPSAPAAAPHTKQYVFVDEYNRHKRLKVMRACDGCRKRKIKCDGAVQNGPWPCGACQRLKLRCVPPTLDQDEDGLTPDSTATTSSSKFSFENSTIGSVASSVTSNGVSPYAKMVHEWSTSPAAPIPTSAPTPTSAQPALSTSVYGSQFFSEQTRPSLAQSFSSEEFPGSSARTAQPPLTRTETVNSESSGGDPEDASAAQKELSQQMGELTVDETSVAPWIRDQHKKASDVPYVDDANVLLPPSVHTDSAIRIPPEMMPTEERALDYFGYFFEYIHPYVPVLNRNVFYDQWRTNRQVISPLILEGIFASVAQYLEDPIEVRRWLALAARHEESFRDTPRLSTIQALLILTKAREFVPRPGYYYRSWMAAQYMTTMACDLSLHDHLNQHRLGKGCSYSRADCLLRTRIWQTLFSVEIMIGAPQGRTNFAVELDTVDVTVPSPSHEIDSFEHQLARRTTYFTQAVRNIKQTNVLWQTIRKLKKDWALDPMFMRQNEMIPAWLKTLPSDVQIRFPDDESPPFLGSDHFIAWLHVYHYLIVIMHHRPQLQMLMEKRDSSFKVHLDVCNDAATKICRLQEALLRDFGLHGMQFMQRGTNFAIYCVLSCAMLHLVTITSPDPAINTRARHYFTRHMRVLERCIPSASPEVKVQIDALRQAFSNDTSREFELKPDLGLRSPSIESKSTPPAAYNVQITAPDLSAPGSSGWQPMQEPLSSKTISPSSDFEPSYHQTPVQPMLPYNASNLAISGPAAFAGLPQISTAPQTGYALETTLSNEQQTPVWDPSGIFREWNTAFGPAALPAQTQRAPQGPEMQQPVMAPQTQQSPGAAQHLYAQQMPPANVMPAVTPVMWQNAFTDAYVSGHGHKRFRDDGTDGYGGYQKRRG